MRIKDLVHETDSPIPIYPSPLLTPNLQPLQDKAPAELKSLSIFNLEKQFRCDRCGSFFKRKQELMRHCRTIHGGDEARIYACPNCQRKFARLDALKRHLGSIKAKRKNCGRDATAIDGG